jgi:hypothetical protein
MRSKSDTPSGPQNLGVAACIAERRASPDAEQLVCIVRRVAQPL